MEHFSVFKDKYEEWLDKYMKGCIEKFASPFVISGDDVEIEWGKPIDYLTLDHAHDREPSIGYSTGYDVTLSGVTMFPVEPESIIKLTVEQDGIPVNLDYTEINVIDAEKGIIEIKKYKKGGLL